MKKLVLWSLLIINLLYACGTKEKKVTEDVRIDISRFILNYCDTYNKGRYEALAENFAKNEVDFLEAQKTTAKAIIARLKQKQSQIKLIPDLLQLKVMTDNRIQIPVTHQSSTTQRVVLTEFVLDEDHKIISYQENKPQDKEVPTAAKNQKTTSYIGNYIFKKGENIRQFTIHSQDQSQLHYTFSLFTKACVGEFTGTAFFVKEGNAVGSNSNSQCKLRFLFTKEGQLQVIEDEDCLQNRQGCSFTGMYTLVKVSL